MKHEMVNKFEDVKISWMVFVVRSEAFIDSAELHPDDMNGMLESIGDVIHNGTVKLPVIEGVVQDANDAMAGNNSWHQSARDIEIASKQARERSLFEYQAEFGPELSN